MKQMTIIPRISEKAYAVSANGVYVFRVPLNLNKNEIKAAVEAQFDVTVLKVKTLVYSLLLPPVHEARRAPPRTPLHPGSSPDTGSRPKGRSARPGRQPDQNRRIPMSHPLGC